MRKLFLILFGKTCLSCGHRFFKKHMVFGPNRMVEHIIDCRWHNVWMCQECADEIKEEAEHFWKKEENPDKTRFRALPSPVYNTSSPAPQRKNSESNQSEGAKIKAPQSSGKGRSYEHYHHHHNRGEKDRKTGMPGAKASWKNKV